MKTLNTFHRDSSSLSELPFGCKYNLHYAQTLRYRHADNKLRYWGGPVTKMYKGVGYRSARSLYYALKKNGYKIPAHRD